MGVVVGVSGSDLFWLGFALAVPVFAFAASFVPVSYFERSAERR